ncbi:hypothetical protein SAMD00023353_3600080 [Rosellinia necatrix]|uniref:Uncharacterized protein n=1 Tax=Rosellinia necatrix TaxID=77044 RepID=A0A1W2TMY5_ROSNE|nr:hypothetical protein SAMD00023353_3600080 [Rosellinia necatrix]
MCGEYHCRESLGGALAVLGPSPSQIGIPSVQMVGRLVFHNKVGENSVATHAVFTADPSPPSPYPSTTGPCLVRIHETGDLTRPATTSPSWAAFSLKPIVGATGDGRRLSVEVELERPLKIEVGVDGIIGRRVSIWTQQGTGPVAEGIVGYN